MTLQKASVEYQKPQEEDRLQKITITLISFYLRLCLNKELDRPQSAFAIVYDGLKSCGYHQYAASLRDKILKKLQGRRPTSRASSSLQLSDDISELLQEAKNDEGILFSVMSFGQKSVELNENDLLRCLGHLEHIEITDYSIDLDLKLTAASGIACAQRSRALNPEEGRSFFEVCCLLYDRFDRFSPQGPWGATSPHRPLPFVDHPPPPLLPASLSNQLLQLDQLTKRLYSQGQIINDQQMVNQQDSSQLLQTIDLLSQQVDQIIRFLSAAVGQVAPPSTPEGLPQPQHSVVDPDDFVSDSDDPN